MVKDELHPEKRDIVVSFKVTETERQKLDAYCASIKVDSSKVIRHAIKSIIK